MVLITELRFLQHPIQGNIVRIEKFKEFQDPEPLMELIKVNRSESHVDYVPLTLILNKDPQNPGHQFIVKC